MTPIYTHHEGSQVTKPAAIDTTSSKTAVFLRKNIEQITRQDEQSGEEVTLWSYDEAKLTNAEYTAYLAEDTAAKIEYIAMMSDIEFDEED